MTKDEHSFNWFFAVAGTLIYIALGGLSIVGLIAFIWWLGFKLDLFCEPTLKACIIIYGVICGIALLLYLLLLLFTGIITWREKRAAKKAGAYELYKIIRKLERQ
ncbi:MAG: hypothetical protein HUK10_18105 [Bacteroides heparinolyticus]|nr:hypothetical protein [Bacteroides heparinolyticus]